MLLSELDLLKKYLTVTVYSSTPLERLY